MRGAGRTARRLAGVDVARGLALLSRSRDAGPLRRVRVAVTVRAVLLLALGLALGTVDSPPLVIVWYYALLFLVAVPLLGLPLRVRRRWPTSGCAPRWSTRSRWRSRAAPGCPSSWLSPASTRADLDDVPARRPGGGPARAAPASGRGRPARDRHRAGRRIVAAVRGAAVGGGRRRRAGPTDAGAGPAGSTRAFSGGLFGVTPTTDVRWLLVASPRSGTTLDLVGTAGSTLAVLGLCLLLTGRWAGLLWPLACAGSMTLTLYTGHVLALRTRGPLLLDDRTGLWVLHVAVALVATLWRPSRRAWTAGGGDDLGLRPGRGRYGAQVITVGLTGGIGSGKSEVARLLAARGAVVVDADPLAREAVGAGTEGLAAVVAEFGPGVLAADGSLNRAALGRVVFGDADRRAALEAIVHPHVGRRSAERMAAAAPDAVVVHDVPLLVEQGMQDGFDARVPMVSQTRRDDRLAAADFVVVNDGNLDDLRTAVDRLWTALTLCCR